MNSNYVLDDIRIMNLSWKWITYIAHKVQQKLKAWQWNVEVRLAKLVQTWFCRCAAKIIHSTCSKVHDPSSILNNSRNNLYVDCRLYNEYMTSCHYTVFIYPLVTMHTCFHITIKWQLTWQLQVAMANSPTAKLARPPIHTAGNIKQ